MSWPSVEVDCGGRPAVHAATRTVYTHRTDVVGGGEGKQQAYEEVFIARASVTLEVLVADWDADEGWTLDAIYVQHVGA
jgi:hypothetical protein